MARRMTYAEKQAAREQREADAARAEQQRQMDGWRKKHARERGLVVFTSDAAFKVGRDDAGQIVDERACKSAMALDSMIGEYRRHVEHLRRNLERMQARVGESLQRLSEGRLGSGYSTMLGDLPADIEQSNAQAVGLASGIAQLAWATGWHVNEIHDERSRAQWRLLVSLDIIGAPVEKWNGLKPTYIVRSTQGETVWYLSVSDGRPALVVTEADAFVYDTEYAAWRAAMVFAGEYV